MRVVDLAAELPVSRPAVSKHLRLLGAAGLVTATPSGRETRYALRRRGLEPLNAYLATLAVRAPFAEHTLDALSTSRCGAPCASVVRPPKPPAQPRRQHDHRLS